MSQGIFFSFCVQSIMRNRLHQLLSHFKLSRQKLWFARIISKSHLWWSWSVKLLSKLFYLTLKWISMLVCGTSRLAKLKSFITPLNVTLWSMNMAEFSWRIVLAELYILCRIRIVQKRYFSEYSKNNQPMLRPTDGLLHKLSTKTRNEEVQ